MRLPCYGTENHIRMDRVDGWFPKPSQAEMRRLTAETLYDLEMECIRQGYLEDPALVYDEERELFRFTDGRFAFSRRHADWELLKKRGRLKGM